MKAFKRIVVDVEQSAASKVDPFFKIRTTDAKALRRQTALMFAAAQPDLMRAYTEGVLFAREILKSQGAGVKLAGAQLSIKQVGGMTALAQREVELTFEVMARQMVIDYEWMRMLGMGNERRAAIFATGDGEKRWEQTVRKVKRLVMATVSRISDVGYYDGLKNGV